MFNLSDASIACILRSLSGETPPSTLDSFRRTCKRINNQVCSMGFDKLEDVCLTLSSLYQPYGDCRKFSKRRKRRRRNGYDITSAIGFKELCTSPRCGACDYRRRRRMPNYHLHPMPMMPSCRANLALPMLHTMRILPQSEAIFSDLPERSNHLVNPYPTRSQADLDRMAMDALPDPWVSDRETNGVREFCSNGAIFTNFARKTEYRPEKLTSEHFCRIFDASLKRIRSVGVLKLSGWFINENVIQYLTNCRQLLNLHEVHLVNCVVTVTKEEFRTFLHSRSITEIHLNSMFRKFSMDESCLMNAKRVFLNPSNEKFLYFGYTGITDNLVNKWIETPPTRISFFMMMKTNITVNGILNLLRASLAINSSSEYNLGEMYATRREFEILQRASQEMRGLNWEFIPQGYNPTQVTITSKTNDQFELIFGISIKKTPLQTVLSVS